METGFPNCNGWRASAILSSLKYEIVKIEPPPPQPHPTLPRYPKSYTSDPNSIPFFAHTNPSNPRPVLSQSMLTNPGFCSENSIQPSPFSLAVSYIMSRGN